MKRHLDVVVDSESERREEVVLGHATSKGLNAMQIPFPSLPFPMHSSSSPMSIAVSVRVVQNEASEDSRTD